MQQNTINSTSNNREGQLPQPVSPTIRVTRFSKIFSTILFRIAATGSSEKVDRGAEADEDEDGVRGGDAIVYWIAGEFGQPKFCDQQKPSQEMVETVELWWRFSTV